MTKIAGLACILVVLLFVEEKAFPEGTFLNAPKPVADELSTIECTAKEVFHAADAGNWAVVFADVVVIGRNWDRYCAKVSGKEVPSRLLAAMEQSVDVLQENSTPYEEDRVGTMRAANDVSWAILDIIDYYHPAAPTNVARIDVLERRIVVDTFSRSFITARNTMEQLRAMWGVVRPTIVEGGGAGIAARLDAALAVQAGKLRGKDAKATRRHAEAIFDGIDKIQEIYLKQSQK